MKMRLILYSTLFLLLTCRGRAQDTAIMRQLILTHFDGVATKDFVRMAATCTGDYVIYEDGKIWNLDSVYYNVQRHQPFTVKFTLTDFHLFADTRSGDGSYYSHADFIFHDSVKLALDFIETATFRKTAEGWRIHSIHVTSLDSPEVNFPAFYKRYDTVRYIPEHYRKRMQLFAGEPRIEGGIVFLGNSITEYGDWKRLLNDPKAVNRGIAGDNTFGMLDRLAEVTGQKPGMVFIEAGINDIGQNVPVKMITGNIHSMVEWIRVRSPATKIYTISVLPTNANAKTAYPDVAGKNAIVQELDRQLRQQAARDGYTYIDLRTPLTDANGTLDAKYAKPDGLHLNANGYEILRQLIKPHL
jgi:lysophospholipase L1-like esterase